MTSDDVMAAISKVTSYQKSVNRRILLEEKFCQISSDPI